MNISIAIIISYILGSIPFAFLLGKIFKNIDLRKVGSGNIGATNLYRIAGYRIGIIALLLDTLKGVIPVLFLADMVNYSYNLSEDSIRLILGIMSICGHNWTIFLKFKGGKGIATSLGVLIGLAIKNVLIAKILGILALVWFSVFLISGYVSLASILSALFFPIFLLFFRLDPVFICFGILVTIFAIIRHKSNIDRLLQHKENRFDIKSKLFSKK